jgi:hypothetical protein
MRFAFIAKHRSIWPVAWLCSALDVSRSGFHAWLNRSPSARSRQDEVLVTKIDRKGGRVRLHRALLQPSATALDAGLYEPRRVRGASYASLTWCPKNRQQATKPVPFTSAWSV